MKKLVALMVALTMVLGLAAVASAADYPTKGLIAINPWSAGGGTDNSACALSAPRWKSSSAFPSPLTTRPALPALPATRPSPTLIRTATPSA